MLLTLEALKDYRNWIGQTVLDVYYSVIRVGGWQNVFPGALPRWASRIRQYFNLTPMTLKLLDREESSRHLREGANGSPCLSPRQRHSRNELQSRGMGISFYAPGPSTRPGTPIIKPDPNAAIDAMSNEIGTMMALSGDVYEDD